jgi:hypothetical protein
MRRLLGLAAFSRHREERRERGWWIARLSRADRGEFDGPGCDVESREVACKPRLWLSRVGRTMSTRRG